MDATGQSNSAATRPARFWISLAGLAAVIFIYVLLMSNRGSMQSGTTGPAIGRSLGYLRFKPLTGNTSPVELADLQGRVTLINFWGTWCPPCIRELPEIVDLSERFAGREAFRLYAVSCGQERDADLAALREETEMFLRARGSKLPTYADQNGATRQALSLTLGISMAYPTTLVLDRQGTVRGFWQGYVPGAVDEMGELIDKLLAETK